MLPLHSTNEVRYLASATACNACGEAGMYPMIFVPAVIAPAEWTACDYDVAQPIGQYKSFNAYILCLKCRPRVALGPHKGECLGCRGSEVAFNLPTFEQFLAFLCAECCDGIDEIIADDHSNNPDRLTPLGQGPPDRE